MSDTSLVLFDPGRAVVQGITLPSPPPTRINISGHTYRLQAPRSVLPVIANVIKLVLNWSSLAGQAAKNILHTQISGGSGSTSDPTFLNAVANQVMTSWATSNINSKIGGEWTLNSCTAKDLGGTTAQSTSTASAVPGTSTGSAMAPGVSVAISWQIVDTYRGGKPRTYLPGIPSNAATVSGGSGLSTAYATSLDTAATLFMNDLLAHPVTGTTLHLGTVSYFNAHAVRPVPVFRPYFAVKIHERIDSQRRRNGRESTFGVTP